MASQNHSHRGVAAVLGALEEVVPANRWLTKTEPRTPSCVRFPDAQNVALYGIKNKLASAATVYSHKALFQIKPGRDPPAARVRTLIVFHFQLYGAELITLSNPLCFYAGVKFEYGILAEHWRTDLLK